MTDIAKWFGSLAPRGWAAIIGGGLLVAIVIIAIARGNNATDKAVTVAKSAGQTEAIATGQAQTLDQLKDANHAQQDLRSDGERSAARYSDCLLDSTRPAACERYRPATRPQ